MLDVKHFIKLGQDQSYINSMRPVIRKKALFSDLTEDYVSPVEPEPNSEVTIRFRTAVNNADLVFLVYKDQKCVMKKVESDKNFDYYAVTVVVGEENFLYYFEIKSGRAVLKYDRRGTVRDINPFYHFEIIPGFHVPAWAKGAVMYQIYVDRFCNGDPTNDVETGEYHYIGDKTVKVTDWEKYPAQMGVREFYGGDLQGVLDKMDYLQDLGVDVIYFNPLFVSPSNHKYDIQDYDHIDPHFGKIVDDNGELLKEDQFENRFATKYINRVTNKANLEASDALFAKVVSEAHKRGMKVIMDGVFNHCGSFNKWLDRERIYENAKGYEKGAYVDEKSPYRNYFHFYNENQWPYNPSYDGWWGHDTLPKLNFEASKELTDYILYIGKKWVSAPYNADGWRLDVAADLGRSPEFNHDFWKKFRKAVKEANPNAIILAEHYGDPKSWLRGDEWDTVMNYDAFMEPLTWFLTGMQKHSDDYREDLLGNADCFFQAMTHHGASFTNGSLQVAMNELSNHDHSRFLTRTNRRVGRIHTLGPEAANEGVDKAVMREAALVQMTWPGAPTIYYGDEAGVCGFTDPDNRRTYPWGKEDKELIAFHKDMISVHKTCKEFLTGSLKHVVSDYNVIGYGRFNKEAQSLIVVNNNDSDMVKEISVWELGIPKECTMEQLILTTKTGYSTKNAHFPVINGKVLINLPPKSAIVLRHVNKQNNKKFLHFE